MKTPDPTFWPLSETQTAVQVHTPVDANLLKRHFEAVRIAFSITGERLEVFRVNRSIEMTTDWITGILPAAKEVFGGHFSHAMKRPTI